jgi:hypothetical protein
MAEEVVIAGGDVEVTPNWREGLPEDIRENPFLTRYSNMEEAAKGIIEAQNLISSTRPTIPKADAPEEEWGRFYGTLGRPEKPEGYEIAKPEKLPEGFPYDEALEGQFRTWAHKAGLTGKQTKALYDDYMEANVGNFNTIMGQAQVREAKVTEALQNLWKGDYEPNLNLARKTAQHYIKGAEDWEALAFALNNDERLVQIFHRIGKDLSEDTLRTGLPLGATSFKKQADEKMVEIMGIPKNDPKYARALQEAQELYKKAEEQGELT